MLQIYKNKRPKSKESSEKEEKMTFRGYYFSIKNDKKETEKDVFIREIAEACYVSPSTVRCWIAGTYRPDPLKQSIIASKLGSSPKLLFPDEI